MAEFAAIECISLDEDADLTADLATQLEGQENVTTQLETSKTYRIRAEAWAGISDELHNQVISSTFLKLD